MNLEEKEIRKELTKIEIKLESLIKVCNATLENLNSFESRYDYKDINIDLLKKIKNIMFLPIFLVIKEEIEDAINSINEDSE